VKKIYGALTPIGQEFVKNRVLYLMTLPGVAFFIMFNYMPMGGIILAFKNFKFGDGIFGSAFSQPLLKNFDFFFSSDVFARVTRNTLLLNASFIVFGMFLAVFLALTINEIALRKLKRIIQASVLLPYFVSWIVVSVFVFALLNYDYGIVNNILAGAGMERVDWYNTKGVWPPILVFINAWKFAGYNSVLFLATLAGIDPTYYEAAEIDGATKWRQIRHISIPFILPTLTTLTLLSVGRIMNADFGMFYSIVGENALLYPTTDTIDVYIYRTLRRVGDIGMASAAGAYQSIVAFALVLISNRVARRFNPDGSLF